MGLTTMAMRKESLTSYKANKEDGVHYQPMILTNKGEGNEI